MVEAMQQACRDLQWVQRIERKLQAIYGLGMQEAREPILLFTSKKLWVHQAPKLDRSIKLKIAPDDIKGNITEEREHRYAYLPPKEFRNPYKCIIEEWGSWVCKGSEFKYST